MKHSTWMLATEKQWWTGAWLIRVQGKKGNQYIATEAPDQWKAKGFPMQRPPPNTCPLLCGVIAVCYKLVKTWIHVSDRGKRALLLAPPELHSWISPTFRMNIWAFTCVLLSLRWQDSPPFWAQHGSITANLLHRKHLGLGDMWPAGNYKLVGDLHLQVSATTMSPCDIVESKGRLRCERQCGYWLGLIRLILIPPVHLSLSVILL